MNEELKKQLWLAVTVLIAGAVVLLSGTLFLNPSAGRYSEATGWCFALVAMWILLLAWAKDTLDLVVQTLFASVGASLFFASLIDDNLFGMPTGFALNMVAAYIVLARRLPKSN